MGFWDHWVPDANNASTALVNEWAAKEKVEVSIDYITARQERTRSRSQPKPSEIRARYPCDGDWWPHAQAELLEPMMTWSNR